MAVCQQHVIGSAVSRFRSITSTNDFLKRHHCGLSAGTVVVADVQTRGRGRFGRKWHSEKGGLWFSVLFRGLHPPTSFLLGFAGAVSVVRAIRDIGIRAQIKWPNDVFIGKRKVCGILSEGIFAGDAQDLVVGIGINLNNPRPLPSATTLKIEVGREIDSDALLGSIILYYNKYYSQYLRGNYKSILDDWHRYWPGKGKKLSMTSLHGRISGVAQGVASDGSLLVRTSGKRLLRVVEGDIA